MLGAHLRPRVGPSQRAVQPLVLNVAHLFRAVCVPHECAGRGEAFAVAVAFRSAGISGFWSPIDSTGASKSDLPA